MDPWPTYVVLERVARQLRRPLAFIECGPDDKPSPNESLAQLRRLCPSVRFLRLGGLEPVSEEVKRQALASADVAVSLVDNAQETFGLAVAEAMAAGLPLVVSDWSGYRDLVRDGIDGYLIPSAWAASAEQVSVPLGWQQCTGIQGFPAIAGALAQLVKIDLAAAEIALLTVLTQPVMARGGGAAVARRARHLFSPEVVMDAHEALFWNWRNAAGRAPADAHCARPVSPQLDPVRVFAHFASHPSTAIQSASTSIHALPDSVRLQRAPLWGILEQSLPASEFCLLEKDLICKHHQEGLWIGCLLHDETFELDPFPPPLNRQPLATLVVSSSMCCSLFFDTGLVALPWAAVGVSGVDSSAVDGRCACAPYPLAVESGVQY